MNGFFVEYFFESGLKSNRVSSNETVASSFDAFNFDVKFNSKFQNDKFIHEDSDCVCALDGVIFNKKSLQENAKFNNWPEFFSDQFSKFGSSFLFSLRGSFVGFFYCKKTKNLQVYNDHVGSKFLYYRLFDDKFIASTDIDFFNLYLKSRSIDNELNVKSAYMLLSFGFMLEEYTLAKNTLRLMPATLLKIDSYGVIQKKQYHVFNNDIAEISERECIERMDFLFRQAIRRQFDKDNEYGYSHLVGLSGGLDSRMTTVVANELGYTNQTNFTFAQSKSYDAEIACDIASKLDHEWIFKSLDGGNFLKDYKSITQITGGHVLFYGLAHANSFYKKFNFSDYGLVHTGQLGDVVFGTFSTSHLEHKPWNLTDGAYSDKLLSNCKDIHLVYEYANEEIFKLYNRGFLGANNGLASIYKYSETFSPFYDFDVINFSLSISPKLRYNHYIYKKWIEKKYPFAANFIWESTKSKINSPMFGFGHKKYYLPQLIDYFISKFAFGNFSGFNDKKNMNPIGYWLTTNKNLETNFKDFYNTTVQKIKDPSLKLDIDNIFNFGTPIEKVQVISLLSAIDMYYS